MLIETCHADNSACVVRIPNRVSALAFSSLHLTTSRPAIQVSEFPLTSAALLMQHGRTTEAHCSTLSIFFPRAGSFSPSSIQAAWCLVHHQAPCRVYSLAVTSPNRGAADPKAEEHPMDQVAVDPSPTLEEGEEARPSRDPQTQGVLRQPSLDGLMSCT